MKLSLIFALSLAAVSCGQNSAPAPSCEEGRDSLLQAVSDSVLLNAMSSSPDIPGAVVTIAEADCGKIRAHSAIVRHWKTGELIDSLELSDSAVIMPGVIMQPATLAHMMERHGLSLEQSIPTRHGVIDEQLLPRIENIERYEKETGKDSISIREAFLNASVYAPYYLADTYLTSRKGYESFSADLDSFFGIPSLHPYPDYQLNGYSRNTPHTLASGHSIYLSHQQIQRFYCMLAGGGNCDKVRMVSRQTADSLSSLLRQNVGTGSGRHLSESAVQISGAPGYGQCFRAPLPAFGTVDLEHPLYVHSFAGFYPSAEPRYAIVVSLFSRKRGVDERHMDIVEKLIEQ